MPKDQAWIESKVLPQWNSRANTARMLYEERLMQQSPSIADAIAAVVTPYGSVREVVERLIASERGLWFAAGWHDQAVLNVSQVIAGDARLLVKMLRQFNLDIAQQNGDMIVGFAPFDEDWIVAIEVSRERQQWRLVLQPEAEIARIRLKESRPKN